MPALPVLRLRLASICQWHGIEPHTGLRYTGAPRGNHRRRGLRPCIRRHSVRGDGQNSAVHLCQRRRERGRNRGRLLAAHRGSCEPNTRARSRNGRRAAKGSSVTARQASASQRLHAENAKESQPAAENVRGVWAAVCLAQEVGERLGRRQDVLGPLQKRASSKAQGFSQIGIEMVSPAHVSRPPSGWRVLRSLFVGHFDQEALSVACQWRRECPIG